MSGGRTPNRGWLVGTSVVLAAAAVFVGILLFKPADKGGAGGPSTEAGAGPRADSRTRQPRPPRPAPGPVLDILLSVNESQNASVLFMDSDSLFRVRVRNVRAYLDRIQNPDKPPRIPPLVLGTAERSLDQAFGFFIVSAEAPASAACRSLPVRMLPPSDGGGPRISLDGNEEGSRSYRVSPEAWAGLEAGDYDLYVECESQEGGGRARSNAVRVTLAAFPPNPSPEELDARAYARARSALADGNETRALALLDEVIAKAPPATTSLILKAELLEGQGKLEEAYGLFEKALDDVLARRAKNKDWSEPPDYVAGRLRALKKKLTGKTGI